MVAGHCAVTLAEVKQYLGVRQADTAKDELYSRVAESATELCEQIAGRRFVYRGQGDMEAMARAWTGPLDNGVIAINAALGSLSSPIVRYAESSDGQASGTMVVSGSREGVARSSTIAINPSRRWAGAPVIELFDYVSSIEMSGVSPTPSEGDPDGDPPVPAVPAVNVEVLMSPHYSERHIPSGAPVVYLVNRPVVEVVRVDEGYYPGSLMQLSENYFTVSEATGRLARRPQGSDMVDFPEDYYFRFASRSEKELGSWGPECTVGYVAGYAGPASVPWTIKEGILFAVRCMLGERERKDADTNSSGPTPGNVQRRVDWREDLKKILSAEASLSLTGERL